MEFYKCLVKILENIAVDGSQMSLNCFLIIPLEWSRERIAGMDQVLRNGEKIRMNETCRQIMFVFQVFKKSLPEKRCKIASHAAPGVVQGLVIRFDGHVGIWQVRKELWKSFSALFGKEGDVFVKFKIKKIFGKAGQGVCAFGIGDGQRTGTMNPDCVRIRQGFVFFDKGVNLIVGEKNEDSIRPLRKFFQVMEIFSCALKIRNSQ